MLGKGKRLYIYIYNVKSEGSDFGSNHRFLTSLPGLYQTAFEFEKKSLSSWFFSGNTDGTDLTLEAHNCRYYWCSGEKLPDHFSRGDLKSSEFTRSPSWWTMTKPVHLGGAYEKAPKREARTVPHRHRRSRARLVPCEEFVGNPRRRRWNKSIRNLKRTSLRCCFLMFLDVFFFL